VNERIRELVEETIRAVDVVYEDNPLNEELAKMYIPDCFAEKFAELIVEECVGILMKPDYAMTHPEELSKYNEGWVNGRLLGIEHIKEHFGVEE